MNLINFSKVYKKIKAIITDSEDITLEEYNRRFTRIKKLIQNYTLSSNGVIGFLLTALASFIAFLFRIGVFFAFSSTDVLTKNDGSGTIKAFEILLNNLGIIPDISIIVIFILISLSLYVCREKRIKAFKLRKGIVADNENLEYVLLTNCHNAKCRKTVSCLLLLTQIVTIVILFFLTSDYELWLWLVIFIFSSLMALFRLWCNTGQINFWKIDERAFKSKRKALRKDFWMFVLSSLIITVMPVLISFALNALYGRNIAVDNLAVPALLVYFVILVFYLFWFAVFGMGYLQTLLKQRNKRKCCKNSSFKFQELKLSDSIEKEEKDRPFICWYQYRGIRNSLLFSLLFILLIIIIGVFGFQFGLIFSSILELL